MKKYQAIIFDMNGVIVDDEPLHVKADIKACDHFGLIIPDEEWLKIKGWKSAEIFARFIQLFGNGKNLSPEAMTDYKVKSYLEMAITEALPVAGAIDFIKFARQHFPKVALATATLKELQEYVFDKFELADYFDAIVTAEDMEKGKPDPDSYLKAASKLGLETKDCLVVEDSLNGVMSGKRAGCDVFAITTTYPREQLVASGADQVFDSFIEMRQFLER